MKKMKAIVRSRRRLWMTLDGKNWQFSMVHALDATIVEIEARHLQFRRYTLGRNAPTVILRSNQNAVSRHLFYWLVGAAMAEFEPDDLGSESQSQNLVP